MMTDWLLIRQHNSICPVWEMEPHSRARILEKSLPHKHQKLTGVLLQVLTAAVDALASAPEGTGRWSAAWSGAEALSSPAEELIHSMHYPHSQAGLSDAATLLLCNSWISTTTTSGRL